MYHSTGQAFLFLLSLSLHPEPHSMVFLLSKCCTVDLNPVNSSSNTCEHQMENDPSSFEPACAPLLLLLVLLWP